MKGRKRKQPAPPPVETAWCQRCRNRLPVNHVCPSANAADLAAGRMAVVGVRMDRRTIAGLDKLRAKRKGDSYYTPPRSLLVTEAVMELLKREGCW